jgi:N-acetylmuramoyl-L-alanine amidase
MVLDLRQTEQYKIFRLDRPDRIVIDLWRTGSVMPPQEVPPGGLRPGEEGGWLRPLPLIVIDPGHGGSDPGAIGRTGLEEKDVVFSISRRLKRILSESGKAKVALTRDKDVLLALEARTSMANTLGADLFVSIHANGSTARVARGVETYYLDNTTDRAAMRVADIENRAASKKEDDLQLILQDLRLSSNANASHQLAFLVQKELIGRLQKGYREVDDLGAKGNLFYVLVGAHMPSILVEVSFISNPDEEKRLRDPEYLEAVAGGVAAGIETFLDQQDYSSIVAEYRQEG